MPVIIGQSQPLQILSNALESRRFHHAWIFSGPYGVGKFTTALLTAHAVLEQAGATNALDHSMSAAELAQWTHPDLHIIRKELALYSDEKSLRERKQLNIPIDLLRERVIGGKVGETWHEAPAYRTSIKGKGKVFIIDEAHLLAREAQNAMLKTLEEPPKQTYFFLITHQPDRLYNTIHSRCQHVRFGALSDAEMKQWLKQQDHSGLSNAEQEFILQFAEGSPGSARLAVEYGFADWRAAIDPALKQVLHGEYPVGLGQTLAELVDDFATRWVKNHKNASKDSANKDGVRRMLSFIGWRIRQTIAHRLGQAQHQYPTEPLLQIIDLIQQAERQLQSNVNIRLLLDNLVVQMVDEVQIREPSKVHDVRTSNEGDRA